MQGRRWKWSAGLALLGVVACGDDAVELIGDAMVDVGDSMVAVGDALVRDASSDASAQPSTTLESPCRMVGTRRREGLNAEGAVTFVQETDFYEASFDVDFDPRSERQVRAVACGPVVVGDPYGCTGATVRCSQTGAPRYAWELPCSEAGVSVDDASNVVVSCGSVTRTMSSGTTTESGTHHTTVRLVVD